MACRGARSDNAGRRWSALSRRAVIRGAGAVAIGGGWLSGGDSRVLAHGEGDEAIDALANVEWPPDLGQTGIQVYVKATGHTVAGSMLDYWRASGAAAIYGHPISEPFAATNGYYSQAFERGILQYRPEFLYTEEPIMRLLPVGRLALRDGFGSLRDGRRMGGGDRRVDIWRRREESDETVVKALAEGGTFVEETGHTISGDFLTWYTANEGAFYLGPPLSEPFSEQNVTVQWFEGGQLRSDEQGVALAPLGAELAPRFGIATSSVPRGDLPDYDELLFWMSDNPNPLGDPYTPGAKWIEISIARQELLAYQGTTLISTSLVSTGLDPNLTELGLFRVRLKYLEQDMQGFTNDTGEVIGVGAAPPGAIPYAVEAVPHVMYFNMDAEALHGAYWHNNFGQKMSHGCVNLPLDFATWLYGWAPLGTSVWIHE